MPMYNASRYLRECIESILAQTFADFELLIVDDGSEDDSVGIVESFADSRIRLIRNRHDYIGSLNLLLSEARGKYIARMDADDMMMPYRLKAQVGYMEKHPDVGVLGGGLQQIGMLHETLIPLRRVTMQEMVNSCCIAHPSVMIRASIFRQYGLCYEEEFKYAEDYRLWMQMFKHEVVFRNLPVPLIKYRISEGQITSCHCVEQAEKTRRVKEDGAQWLLRRIEKVAGEEVQIPVSGNLLTVVIPFLNEKDEVRNTVRSVRNTAGNRVDIIVINDCSDDGYDYCADLTRYHVTYIYNEYRIGAAASKEKGARLATTPYFILLDAHMRCYTLNWHDAIVRELQENDRRILCCQTKALEKDDKNIVYTKNVVPTFAAYLIFDYDDYLPKVHWIEDRKLWKLRDGKVACVLGACYAASRRYWNLLKGLQGLMHYGCEEPYISLKAWMEGGGCKMLPEVKFGHIYRAVPPYRIMSVQMLYNYFVISNTLFPISLRCWADAVGYKMGKSIYEGIRFWLSANKSRLEQLRQYYTTVFHADFNDVQELNDTMDLGRYDMVCHEKKRMPALLDFLKERARTSDISLWNGSMGLLIAICEYEEYAHSDELASLACELLGRITSGITPTAEMSVSFSQGICGIGWGLVYLFRNGLADTDFSRELAIIDSKVMERNPERITDYSFQSGLGGILCYVTHRLYLLQKNGKVITFDTRYLDGLLAAAMRALQETSDFRTHAYALLLQEYGKNAWNVLPPAWKDVIDLPNFLPQDPQNWKTGLDGAVGYFCNLTHALKCIAQMPECATDNSFTNN